MFTGGPFAKNSWANPSFTPSMSNWVVLLRKIAQWRARASLPPVGNRAAYIQAAAELWLGNTAPQNIILREVLP